MIHIPQNLIISCTSLAYLYLKTFSGGRNHLPPGSSLQSQTDGSGCINAPAPSPLRQDIFQAYGLFCVPVVPKGKKPLAPTGVTNTISHLLLAAFPSLPHLPTNISWAPFLDELLAFKSLCQGLLLREPKQKHGPVLFKTQKKAGYSKEKVLHLFFSKFYMFLCL